MTGAAVSETQAARRRKGQSLSLEDGSEASPFLTTRKRRKRRKQPRDEPPFFVLFLQVGTVLFLISYLSFKLYRYVHPYYPDAPDMYDDDANVGGGVITVGKKEDNSAVDQYKNEQKEKLDKLIQKAADEAVVNHDPTAAPTAPPLPIFDLSEASKYDAFDLPKTASLDIEKANPKFWRSSEVLKEQFAERYGGLNAAKMILDRALTTFGKVPQNGNVPTDVLTTACRLQRARSEKRPFRFAFGGYSVTTGRGNYFSQAFPFVMKDLLHVPMSLLGFQEMEVQNAAIGGCPAFPYGWCMKNFWGEEPDVVSWDYSMNEAGGVPEGLEAYVRHVLSTYSNSPPKLLVKDTHMAGLRRNVLAFYESQLRDAVVIHTDPATEPFLRRSQKDRPDGFQNWRKFGAPLGAPGQSRHHPAVQEHILLGWLLAMHFMQALEVLASVEHPLECPVYTPPDQLLLQPPVSGQVKNKTGQEYPSVMFGHPLDAQNKSWSMRPMHCRTSFEPIVSGDLTTIVVNGTVAEDIDLLLPKSSMYYTKGWTMDLSEGEKAAKRKLGLYDPPLGFLDNKKAYYGLRMSGTIRFLVPYEPVKVTDGIPEVGSRANEYFSSIVVCEVNEKRDSDACRTPRDVQYIVGGVNVTNGDGGDAQMMNDAGTLFMGKRICMHLSIPPNATLTSRQTLGVINDKATNGNEIGILLEVSVKNHRIIDEKQACSVSHIVWEQQQRPKAAISA